MEKVVKGYFLSLIFFIVSGVVAYALNVQNVQSKWYSYKGFVIQPYWINQNPTTNCNNPTVDTSTTMPSTGSDSTITTTVCLWSTQFSTATTISSSNFVLDLGVSATPTLDGHAISNFNAITSTLSFTTNSAPDLIMVMIATRSSCGSTCVSGTIGGTSISFTLRQSKSILTITPALTLYEFYGVTQTTGAVSITISLASAGNTVAAAFALTNTYISNPFDVQPSQATGNSRNPTITINPLSSANDALIGLVATTGTPTITQGSGFTLIDRSTQTSVAGADEYLAPVTTTGPQTISFSLSSRQNWIIFGEAIKGGGQLTISAVTTTSTGATSTTMFSNQQFSFLGVDQIAASIQISSTTIPANGYIKVQISLNTGAAVRLHWGTGGIPSNFQVTIGVETIG